MCRGPTGEQQRAFEVEPAMGNYARKDVADKRTGMTKREKALLRDTWRKFCQKKPDFGSVVLLAMFTLHPEHQALFPSFEGRDLRLLRDDAKFRTFAAVVGSRLSAMVDSVDDYDALSELAHKNAVDHAQREGVLAEHFADFYSATLGEIIESNKSAMTPAAIAAWEKFFETLSTITKHVFFEADKAAKAAKAAKEAEEAKAARAAAGATSPPHEQGTLSPDQLSSAKASALASPVQAVNPAAQKITSPLAIQSVIKGARSDRKPIWKSGIKEKRSKPPK
ncbi:cytoglobin-1-like [Dermacentor andersoni]|uniref:cytoglobin-1-like n=1 Tax=Dermacentor andersoni TaxID=34620 RepID=UPI0021553E4E|nr:globin-like [Dermacentor andersoni]